MFNSSNATALIPLLVLAVVSPSTIHGVEVCRQPGCLSYTIIIPEYTIVQTDGGLTSINMVGSHPSGNIGYPQLPVLSYTFALPPGTTAEDFEVSGLRVPVEGRFSIQASEPQMMRSNTPGNSDHLWSIYEKNRNRIYSGMLLLPDELGEMRFRSQCREYSLVDVLIFPFYYDPVSEELFVAEEVTIRISYAPMVESQRIFVQEFLDAGIMSDRIPTRIYNIEQATLQYNPQERLIDTPGMIILTTQEYKPYLDRYISWRTSTGFNVSVITLEEILSSSIEGKDTAETIRNWLRANASDNHYLLIVGHHYDIPMRLLNPENGGDYYYGTTPSDIYYADLSLPDSLSWDLDGDGLYGEILDTDGNFLPQDAPDLDAELYVGRINAFYSDPIPGILERTWLFESSQDETYKKSAVLAGGILAYRSKTDKWDDSGYMETLLEDGIIDRELAITLYEKEGENPSSFECDFPLNRENLLAALRDNNVGLFVESNHGSRTSILRTLWFDDNQDGEPQQSEQEMSIVMQVYDSRELNSSYPNVSCLLSCQCGSPVTTLCLAQDLLNNSSVAVYAHSVGAWGGEGGNWEGLGQGGDYDLFYYFLENCLKNPEIYDYVLGDAWFAAKAKYWSETSWRGDFMNAYGYNMFGDPAIRLMGRDGDIPGVSENSVSEPLTLSIIESKCISFYLSGASEVRLEVWDVAGRRVQTLMSGTVDAGSHDMEWDTDGLSSGTYFVTLRFGDQMHTVKTVVIQ